MGLADRDYLRERPGDGMFAGRAGGTGGRRSLGILGLFSFNTWLIVINVAVFFLNGTMFDAPALQRPLFYGEQFTPEFAARASFAQREDARRFTEETLKREFAANPQPVRQLFLSQPVLPIVERPPPGTAPGNPVGRLNVRMVSWTESWGHFSTREMFWPGLGVWRLVTFQFLHANLTHLAFNMMGLYFVGGLVEQYLGSKRYAAYYLTCGIFGAVAYLLLNFLGNYVFPNARIPGLLFDDPAVPLVGASAGIFGVLMAAAYIAPNEIIHVMGIVPARLKPAVYVFTAIAAVNLFWGSRNAGGEAAHLGGAAAGYFFIRRTHLLRDFFDIFGSSKPGSRGSRGGPGLGIAAAPPRPAAPRPTAAQVDPPSMPPGELDRLLGKIRSSGMQSLTPEERGVLERESRARGGAGGSGSSAPGNPGPNP